MTRLAFESQEEIGIELFPYGKNDIVVCKRNKGRSFVSLNMLSESNASDFSEATFDLGDGVRIVEVLEGFENANDPESKFLRLLGIHNNEEVMCLEVRLRDQGLVQIAKVHNRKDRCDFRWPFYAYALNSNMLVINYLHEAYRGFSIHYNLPFKAREKC